MGKTSAKGGSSKNSLSSTQDGRPGCLKATQKHPKEASKWPSYGKNQYEMKLRASKPPFLSLQTPLAQPHFWPLSWRFCIVTTKIGFRIGFYNTNLTLTSYIYINVLPSILLACQRLKVDFVLVFDSPNGPRRIAKLTMYCKLQYQMSVRGSLYCFLSIEMALGNLYRAFNSFWQSFPNRSCPAPSLQKRQFSLRLSNAGQFLDMFWDRSCPEICSKKERIRSASPRKFDFRQPILSERLISSVIVFLCWHVGLWAFRRCVRPFFFVLACGSFCVPSRRQWFILCAGVCVFLRSVAASVIYSLCWRVDLFAFRRGVSDLFFVLACLFAFRRGVSDDFFVLASG